MLIKMFSLLVFAAMAAGPFTGTASQTIASAEKIHSLVNQIKTGSRFASRSILSGRVITVNEAVVNAYVSDLAAKKGKGKITSARAEFIADKTVALTIEGRVEWSQVFKSDNDSFTGKLIAKAGGINSTVHAELETASAKGKAYVRVRSIRVNGIGLPESLISQLLRYVGEKQRPPMDFARLFPLPYGIQKIEIQKGSAVVHF
ncbi:MAG: hypothetical protein HY747_01765 [Elusimicrobia bacterium]|nr:hypothetical protein [Elusimicrobiota bacterium]